MNIQYLKVLRDNPIEYGVENNFEIQGIPMSEIEQLEQAWNNGTTFPIALRELLFLAGNACYVLDYGWFDGGQHQMQLDAREWMTEEGMERTITRPFYVLEVRDEEAFLMVYLDEGDNPFMRTVDLPHRNFDDASWNRNTDRTLKDFITERINDVKQGFNPF